MTEFRAPEVNDFNGQIIAEFRANGGKVGGPFQGADMLLLHHTGARSGTERVSPLALQRVGEALAVFAGVGGGPAKKVTVRARIAQPAECDVIYSRQKHRNPVFADYEVKAAPRRIPVMVLDPIK